MTKQYLIKVIEDKEYYEDYHGAEDYKQKPKYRIAVFIYQYPLWNKTTNNFNYVQPTRIFSNKKKATIYISKMFKKYKRLGKVKIKRYK